MARIRGGLVDCLAVTLGPLDLPDWRWLSLLTLVVPIVWLWATSRVPGGRIRRWVSLVLRLSLVVGLVLALAGARLEWRNKGICVVFVVDQSQSVPGYAREAIRGKIQEAVAKMGRDDQFVIVEFGGDAVLDCLPSFRGPMPPPVKVMETERTDLSRALRLAIASLPADKQKRVVLLSDGNQNSGDVLKEARIAGLSDVQVDTVVIGAAGGHEVMVEQVVVPPRVPKNAGFDLRAIISADLAQPAELLISRDGQPLPSQQVQLKAGTNVFDLRQSLSDGGFHEYQVTVVPGGGPGSDTFAANNTGYGFTQVDTPGKVLVIRGKSKEHDYVTDALRDSGIETESGDPSAMPMELKYLLKYDCIVLQNVNGFSLARAQMDSLAHWVKDFGGGIVLIGGDESFGPGGYKDTPLEEISPLEMDVKRKKHLASLAMCMVLDKSGSMGMTASDGRQKIELASQGCVETLKLLGPSDEAQIGAVDTEVAWMTKPRVEPMTEMTKAVMKRNVLALRAGGGGIYCATALSHAYDLVNAPTVHAMARHVILFADTADSEQQEGCIDMARKNFLRSPSVTTTVIGLGVMTDSDVKFQQEVARVGGGRWYITDNAMDLPRIFVKEAFIAARSVFVEKKEGIVPTVYDSPLWLGMDKGIPRVYGYVGTTLKPRATLAAHGLEPDDPLLAHWSIGLGKAVAFTSDATDRWGKDWVAWEGFNKFWAQTIRWASKSIQNSQLTTTTTVEGSDGRIIVEAVGADGRPINNLALQGKVAAPDENDPTMTPRLEQIAPGRYEGHFNVRQRGTYLVDVVDERTGSAVDWSAGVLSYPAEFRDLQPNAALMRRISETTAGLERNSLDGVFTPKEKSVKISWPIANWLVLFAAAGLLMDVAWRRLNVADWFKRQREHIMVQGAGSAVGVFQSIKTGRREVQSQRDTLRERIAVAAAAPPVAPSTGTAGDLVGAARASSNTAVADAPHKQGESAGKGGEGPGYASRLMNAKKRAEEKMREQQ